MPRVRKTKKGLALKRWFKEDWKNQGDEGIYFGNTGSLAYDLVGDGGYYYKNTSDEFLLLSEGLILSSSSPC